MSHWMIPTATGFPREPPHRSLISSHKAPLFMSEWRYRRVSTRLYVAIKLSKEAIEINDVDIKRCNHWIVLKPNNVINAKVCKVISFRAKQYCDIHVGT